MSGFSKICSCFHDIPPQIYASRFWAADFNLFVKIRVFTSFLFVFLHIAPLAHNTNYSINFNAANAFSRKHAIYFVNWMSVCWLFENVNE